jgi:hypothetical protein
LNSRCPVFAQHATLFELTANAQHTTLHPNARAIPGPCSTALVVFEITPIQSLAPTTIHPKMHRAHRDSKTLGDGTDWLTISNRSNHLLTTRRLELFSSYNLSSKKSSTLLTCSTVAESQVFNEC